MTFTYVRVVPSPSIHSADVVMVVDHSAKQMVPHVAMFLSVSHVPFGDAGRVVQYRQFMSPQSSSIHETCNRQVYASDKNSRSQYAQVHENAGTKTVVVGL